MVTPQFKKYYEQLNPEQKKAVDSIEGAVMVIAGPGTGKTQILTLRVANILLQTDTPPESILALTFTESGVAAMRKRLVEITAREGYRVYITTFHGFCNDVIQGDPEYFRHLAGFEPITDLEQIQILSEIISQTSFKALRPFGDPIHYTKAVLAAINDLKKEGVDPAEFRRAVKKQRESFEKIGDLYYEKGAFAGKMKGKYVDEQKAIAKNEELSSVYELYQDSLRKNKFYDYSDMIMEVARALEGEEELRLSLQERHLYILVDEHQDTNAAQNSILRSLTSFFENPNLFIVGDEKQAIYRFQGASLENFLYFKKIYPQAQLISLGRNYRSTQAVLDASGSLIAKNVLPDDFRANTVRLMSTVDYPSQKIQVAALSSPVAEMRFVAEDITKRLEAGVAPNEVAVIFRNNKDVYPLTAALDRVEVPYVIESDQDLLSDPDVRKVLDILKAVCYLGDDPYLVPLLHMDIFAVDPLDIFKVIKFCRKQNRSVLEAIKDPADCGDLVLANPESLRRLYGHLDSWARLSQNETLEDLYVTVLQESGMLKKVLESPRSLDRADKLAALFAEVRRYSVKNRAASLAGFLDYIRLLEDHQLLIKRSPRNILPKAVRLMTAHRSKGLEFECVYIIQALDGHWGNKRAVRPIKLPWRFLDNKAKIGEVIDQNEDERRLFYVAMTRAKKHLLISYSRLSEEGRELLPAQFIEEIDPQLKAEADVAAFENHWTQSPELLFLPKPSRPDFGDKDFFNFIFLQEGLSVTGLNNYLKCPWRYFYTNLVQIPFRRERSQIYGITIHGAICKFINHRRKRLTAGSPQADRQLLVSFYRDSLQEEELLPKDFDELFEKGSQALRDYYDHFYHEWKGDIICEYEIRDIRLSDNVKLSGRIDRLERIANSNQVVITDLKTGKPRSRHTIEGKTAGATGDFKRQLLFYKLLVEGLEDRRWAVKKGVVEFVEPDEKGAYHREELELLPEEVGQLKKTILQIAEEILSLSFWDKSCREKDCQYCRFRQLLNI